MPRCEILRELGRGGMAALDHASPVPIYTILRDDEFHELMSRTRGSRITGQATVIGRAMSDKPEELPRVLGRFPEIAAVYLFGSVARGNARPDSDVDLGIVFRRRGETALDHYRLLGDLASRLEAFFPDRTVDLVVLESQGPLFCRQALQGARLVHEADPDRRIDFESATHIRAFDMLPTWEFARRGRREFLDRTLGALRP
ncbi:MAG: nucleotidyltransferase domain-containing protein [Planctomycetes bacterium]|nr:nucleotidyltransferase domain-containing protein [Planctomycetota bacterium]